MFTGGGAIKGKTEARDRQAFCPSLALAQARGPLSPRLQPHLERLHSEVDAAVGLGLRAGQGAPWRQQREGLQQARQHHEQLQARERLTQAHTRLCHRELTGHLAQPPLAPCALAQEHHTCNKGGLTWGADTCAQTQVAASATDRLRQVPFTCDLAELLLSGEVWSGVAGTLSSV